MVPLATVGFFLLTSFGAFSRKIKYEIHERDNWTCNRCGTTRPPFEASHRDHNKKNPNYNTVNNGDTLCPSCHLEEHIDNAGKNGLSKKNNDWAIRTIKKRT